jgi:DnaD/phage-associated family protein
MTSTPKFAGFPAGPLATTPVPNLFLSEVLPRIPDLGEIQVTLQAFRLLARKRGSPRYLTAAELLADSAVVAGLRLASAADPTETLAGALRGAVERGTLLEVILERRGTGAGEQSRKEIVYFVNGPAGRQAVEDLLAGRLDLGQETVDVPSVVPAPDRPGIYELYEQNVGLLTPLLAEELAEAERLYPTEWIEAAFRQAVVYNRRNWKYVQRVLERWAIEGKQDEEAGRRTGRPADSTTRGREGTERRGYGR